MENTYEVQSEGTDDAKASRIKTYQLSWDILWHLTKEGYEAPLEEDVVCEKVSWRQGARTQEKAQAGGIWECPQGPGQSH